MEKSTVTTVASYKTGVNIGLRPKIMPSGARLRADQGNAVALNINSLHVYDYPPKTNTFTTFTN